MPSYVSPGGVRTSLLVLAGVLVVGAGLRAGQTPTRPQAAPAGSPAAVELFEAKVRPLLAANCYACHAQAAMAGLRVDSREALLRGGETGPALVPGDPEKSALLKAIQHAEGFPRMPRGRARLPAADIAAVAEWIKAGAVWPGSAETTTAATVAPEKAITAEQRAFWSFQPLASHAPPAVTDAAWPRTDIDRFILARLEKEGLSPVGPADKLTLLRRATLDLTGLPPTPEEVDAFLKDDSSDAFEKVVDRLLASPAYGEAWGRVWLDVARYGEDDYRSLDPMGRGLNPYPNAHLYRDWVIRAFNDDLPYDQFVTAQLAADLLEGPERVRHLPALGFLGLGPWYYDNGAVEITRADERHDRVDAVTRGMLGLTVGCARCHDHKYDPIPTKDYYSLGGVFLNTEYHEYPLAPKAIVAERKAKEEALEHSAWFAKLNTENQCRTPLQAMKHEGLAGDRGAEEREGRDHREGEARLRALRPMAGVPREEAHFLSVPEGLAGDDGRRRYGEGSGDSGHRVPGADRQRAPRRARTEEGERHHQGAGAADEQAEEARQPAERVQDERRLLSRLRPRAAQHDQGPHRALPGCSS
jgi:mono/diheme cytochrome c family protein